MASSLNTTRVTIRRRVAPNFPTKKTKIEPTSAANDRDLVTNNTDNGIVQELNHNGESVVMSNSISASVSNISSSEEAQSVEKNILNSNTISNSGNILPCDSVNVSQVVCETEVAPRDTTSLTSDEKVDEITVNPLVPKVGEVNSSVSDFKLLKKRCLPLLPKKRPLPMIKCPSASTLSKNTGSEVSTLNSDMAIKERVEKCPSSKTNEKESSNVSLQAESSEKSVITFVDNVSNDHSMKKLLFDVIPNNRTSVSSAEILREVVENAVVITHKQVYDKCKELHKTNEDEASNLNGTHNRRLKSQQLNVLNPLENAVKDLNTSNIQSTLSGEAVNEECEELRQTKKDIPSDNSVEQLPYSVDIKEKMCEQPTANTGSSKLSMEESKDEHCIKKVTAKPLLAKRALPVLPRKRPVPNVVQAEKSVLPTDGVNEKDNKNIVCNKLLSCLSSNQNQSEGSLDSPKEEIELGLNRIDELKNYLNTSKALEVKSLDSDGKSLEIENSETEEISKTGSISSVVEVPKKGNPSSVVEVPNSNNEVNSLWDNSKIKTVRFLLKKRSGPALARDKSNKFPKIKYNDMEIKSDLVSIDSHSSPQLQDLPVDNLKNVEEISCNSSLEKTINSVNVKSETLKDDSAGSSIKPTVSVPEKLDSDGVVRVFLNCWPQYPSDELSESALYEDQNIEDLGKVSVFTDKKPPVVYCDLKKTEDLKKIPENWVYVNFNKLIKGDFSSHEEIVENGVRCNFSGKVNASSSEEIEKLDSILDPSHEQINDNCPDKKDESSNNNLKSHDGISDSLKGSCTPDLQDFCGEISPVDALSNSNHSDKLKDNCADEHVLKSKNDVTTSPDGVIKVVMIAPGDCGDIENNDKVSSDIHDTLPKPYKFRSKKSQVKNTVNPSSDDENKLEDIFSNADDSNGSEYIVEPEKKVKNPKVKKKPTKKTGAKKGGRPKKKTIKTKKEEKPKVKKERQPKKINEENRSAYKKLGLELKNRNKWDEEGNCAEPDKLELKDFIFYVPKSVPMSQDVKKETNVNPGEEAESEKASNNQDEEGENHGPKLIVKDGKIIIDPNSTKIKQTPIVHAKVEKFEKPKEPNDPWELQETMKFYATLWKYGIDFSMLAGTFPKKSRDSIKKKFNYEERNNSSLLTKTLTKKLEIQAILRELILIDSLDKISRKKVCNTNKRSVEPKKVIKKHCLLPKKKRVRNKKSEDIENSPVNSNVPSLCDEESNQSMLSCISENDLSFGEGRTFDLKDVITFSTNLVYKDMNIIESVSIHPSAVQPLDINVTISHDPDDSSSLQPEPVALETSLK